MLIVSPQGFAAGPFNKGVPDVKHCCFFAYKREVHSMRCLIELLRYTDGKVLLVLDIRGSSFTQQDSDKIGEEHSDATARIKDIESYRFNL